MYCCLSPPTKFLQTDSPYAEKQQQHALQLNSMSNHQKAHFSTLTEKYDRYASNVSRSDCKTLVITGKFTPLIWLIYGLGVPDK